MPAQRRAKSRRAKAREPFLSRIRRPDLRLPGLSALNWRPIGLGSGFLAAAFSLLALLAPGGGTVTREWSGLLLRLFGWSAYLVPFGASTFSISSASAAENWTRCALSAPWRSGSWRWP